ncbi:MAG: hypothetical protein HY270_10110 [Deltaproteobacteria bacterium]|nr:hypothetical protein [Deltaproteobacteria bacterium]
MHKSVLAGIAAVGLGMLLVVPAAQAAPKQAGIQLAEAEAAPAEKPAKKAKKAKKHGHGHKKSKKDSGGEMK